MQPFTSTNPTPQEVLNYVVAFMREQKRPAYRPATNDVPNACLYRFPQEDGTVLKCAAGCLITDEEYQNRFEGVRWYALEVPRLDGFPGIISDLISALQGAHDNAAEANAASPGKWLGDFEDRVRRIAAGYGLVFPEVST